MLKHSFKMIWAERKSNTWILIELIIVFSILWFCSGFVYEKSKTYFEPIGFDIDHVYLLEFSYRKDINRNDYNSEKLADAGITIFERTKKNPMIETACYCRSNAYPYSGSYSTGNFYKNGNLRDSISYTASKRDVSPEFFDVFKIKFQKGRTFDSNEVVAGDYVIVSPDRNNKFYDESILSMEYLISKGENPNATGKRPSKKPVTDEEWEYFNTFYIDIKEPVAGIVNKMKRSDYENYERILFWPLQKSYLTHLQGQTPISVRVKPDADKDFPAKFKREMKEQLKAGPYELVGVKPYKDLRSDFNREDNETMQIALAIVSFLLINVFLGILGTFRFRANARRGEIGLRCAVGSSKRKIQYLLLGETFALLLIASIPGTIIAINIQLTGVASQLGIRASNWIVYAITFLTMLIIVWLGTWYPAKKGSDIQPAEALHYE